MKTGMLIQIFCLILSQVLFAQYHSEYLNEYIIRFQKPNKNSINIYPVMEDERSLYIIRITGVDSESKINFYGFDLSWYHANAYAILWGISVNAGLGNPPVQGKPTHNISLNGINFSLIVTGVTGTINGLSFGGFWGNSAMELNGIATGLLGTNSDYLNGIAVGGLMSFSQYANAIQIAGVLNGYCNFNGIGIALINTSLSGFEELIKSKNNNSCQENKMYGIILGLYNPVDVRGLSLALVNNGNGWFQIGLVNIGDSIIQLGLINLKAQGQMGIPIINFNF